MPKYTKSFSLPGVKPETVFDKIVGDSERWKTSIESMLGKVEIQSDPALKQISLKSKFVNAVFVCLPEEVRVDADLSLMAMPFKGKVDEGIDRWIKKTFPEATTSTS
jgi:hypothetical protein